MLARALSYGIFGIDAYPVDIEVDVTSGLPEISLVGLADTSIKESKVRVKAAIKNSGFNWPAEKITINLAPSHIKKEGAGFDLAIGLGILAATRQIDPACLNGSCFLGELSLDGALRPTRGVLPVAMAISSFGIKNLVVPELNTKEAAMVSGINVWPAKTLKQVIEIVNTPEQITPYKLDMHALFEQNNRYTLDFSDVKGQFAAKRALEIAVAGGHNILMIGPPGSGKTMLAKRIPTIMPNITQAEALEVTKIHSVTGWLTLHDGIVAKRPFRSPHHTISYSALVGGGPIPQPGEISLAHHGVLFLDEFPEFPRNCLEVLRQPLEDGNIQIARATRSFCFPASFMLVCAMNPCPCGYFTDRRKQCRCNSTRIERYRQKISGPLLDRIDIHIDVPGLAYQDITGNTPAESSQDIKRRITKARTIQHERFVNSRVFYNARMDNQMIKKFCLLTPQTQETLKVAINELGLSARAYDKVLRVSRTIADLDNASIIMPEHICEAIQYRSLDKQI